MVVISPILLNVIQLCCMVHTALIVQLKNLQCSHTHNGKNSGNSGNFMIAVNAANINIIDKMMINIAW